MMTMVAVVMRTMRTVRPMVRRSTPAVGRTTVPAGKSWWRTMMATTMRTIERRTATKNAWPFASAAFALELFDLTLGLATPALCGRRGTCSGGFHDCLQSRNHNSSETAERPLGACVACLGTWCLLERDCHGPSNECFGRGVEDVDNNSIDFHGDPLQAKDCKHDSFDALVGLIFGRDGWQSFPSIIQPQCFCLLTIFYADLRGEDGVEGSIGGRVWTDKEYTIDG